jgi:hypothetical protein
MELASPNVADHDVNFMIGAQNGAQIGGAQTAAG